MMSTSKNPKICNFPFSKRLMVFWFGNIILSVIYHFPLLNIIMPYFLYTEFHSYVLNYYCDYYYLLIRVFQIRVSWWFFAGIWVTASSPVYYYYYCYYCDYYSLIRVFHISVSRGLFTGIWMTPSLLKSPRLFPVLWPFSIMLSFG